MRMLTLMLCTVVIGLVIPTPASAAECTEVGLFDQRDLAGVYIDEAAPMRVEIFPCGGVTVLWDNPYGRHLAHYTMNERLPGGGVIGRGLRPSTVGYLDNAYTIALKPGTTGTLEVITASPYGHLIAMYRLKKI